MFAMLHGRQSDRRVHVVRRGNHNCIDVGLVFEHVAKVGVASGLGHMFGLKFDH